MEGFAGYHLAGASPVKDILDSHGAQLKAWAKNQIGKKITAQAVKYYLINGLGLA